jgi:hypothetical protein
MREGKLADEEFHNFVLCMRNRYYETVMEYGCNMHGR